MKKMVLLAVAIVFCISTVVFCADLFIGEKRYEFKYEVAKSPKQPTYVVNRSPYRNPLVVGFKVNTDGTITAIDPANKNKAENNTPRKETEPVATTLAEPAAIPVEASVTTPAPIVINQPYFVKNKVLTVYFQRGSSLIGTKTIEGLNRLPIDITKSEFEVRGFTCPLGSMEINRKLAQERASVVAEIIRARGGKIKGVIGEPMCCYASETDYTKNRRAEIYLITSNGKGGGGDRKNDLNRF